MFLPIKSDQNILALGAEFDTRLALYRNGGIVFSGNIGELANDAQRYEKFVSNFLETHCNTSRRRKPDVIITDLHPLYNSRLFGERLAKKLKIPHIAVQHHIAHIFSAVADFVMHNTGYKIRDTDFYGIACDGTGYGSDGNIWGGEVFRICKNITRIGHLEEQYLIGGEMAVEEPARMVISILSKILSEEKIFKYVKKYYSAKDFNL